MAERVALVTGATRGIGYAVANALAEAGAHVILVGRTAGALEALYDRIVKNGGRATGVPLDLTDFEAIDRLGGTLATRFGHLDMLVGNAGILGALTPAAHIAPKDFADLWAINVAANARLIRAFEPLLLQAPAPRAVFVTSGAADKARPFWAGYAASKAALNALVQSWAREHENTNLRVNLISPGRVRTAMRAQAMPGEDPKTLPAPAELAPLFLQLLDPAETRNAEIVEFNRES